MRVIEKINTRVLTRCALFLAITLAFLLTGCQRRNVYPSPPVKGRAVEIDLTDLRPGEPVFYTYRHGRKHISFFVFKIEGRVLSFFDACETCYPKKLGYRYDEGYVICRACNEEYPVTGLEEGIGSCYPMKLQGLQRNGKYIITLDALEKKAGLF